MRIEIAESSPKESIIIDFRMFVIIYTDKYIRTVYDYTTSEPKHDDSDKWDKEEKRYDFDFVTIKESVLSMDFGWAEKDEVYQVRIETRSAQSIFAWFDNREEGYELYRKLFKWWTGDELPEE